MLNASKKKLIQNIVRRIWRKRRDSILSASASPGNAGGILNTLKSYVFQLQGDAAGSVYAEKYNSIYHMPVNALGNAAPVFPAAVMSCVYSVAIELKRRIADLIRRLRVYEICF